MPFYEYECSNCRFYVEVLQKLSEQPLKKCPSCGKKALKKLVSAPVFRLKGSGWYETDFKSDQEGKRNLAGADKEESSAESKSEAKPAADATAKADVKADSKADSKGESGSRSEVKESKREAATAPRSSGGRAVAKTAKSKSAPRKVPASKRSAPSKSKASSKRRRGR